MVGFPCIDKIHSKISQRAYLPFDQGHSKLSLMNFKPAYPMVLITMAMRSMMRMEMSPCAKWKAR